MLLAPRLSGPTAKPLRPQFSASKGALARSLHPRPRAERRAGVRSPDARAADAPSSSSPSSPSSPPPPPNPPRLRDQASTPLLDAVLLRGSRSPSEAPFHVPGHKRGAGISKRSGDGRLLHPLARLLGGGGGGGGGRGGINLRLLRHDLTELPGLDLLSQPEGAILEAQRLAARAWGVSATRFLVNGSTGGIAAAVLACCRLWARRSRREREFVVVGGGEASGDREEEEEEEEEDDDDLSRPLLLISRGAHRSAAAAAELAGADVVWIEEEEGEGEGEGGGEGGAARGGEGRPRNDENEGGGDENDNPRRRSRFESRWGSEGLGRVATAEGIRRALELARELDATRRQSRKKNEKNEKRRRRARVPAAALVVSPSYFGACSDVSSLAAACRVMTDGREEEILFPLIVDQAHGAHFGLDGRFPPCAAAAAAAAAVAEEQSPSPSSPSSPSPTTAAVLAVASAHKTLDALGQAALLHSGWNVPEPLQREVDRALAALQTSSPSYLLLASLDAARAAGVAGAAGKSGGGGEEEEGYSSSSSPFISPWDEPLRAAAAAAEAVRAVPGAHLLSDDEDTEGKEWDPLRLTVRLEGVGGRALAAALEGDDDDDDDVDDDDAAAAEEAGAAATTAVVEMATSRAVVLALGAGSTVEHAEAFGRALRRVARRKSAKGGGGESGASAAAAAASLPFSPPPGLSSSSSSSSSSRNTELIPLRASPGRRLAAALLAPYPPGIPLVLEGEPLTPAAVAAAAEAWAAGSAVVGLSSSSEEEQREREASCRGEPFVRVFGLE